MNNIIFGIRPVFEAIEAGRPVEKVYFRKGADGQLLVELREVCKVGRINMQEVPVEKLERLVRNVRSHRDAVNHQGVVAQVAAVAYADLNEVLAAIPAGERPLVVVFDGVTDVRNFGAIARSAECAGAHVLVVPLKNAAPVNADAVKSSAGALNVIPVCRAGSIRNTLKMLQNEGFRIVAATEKGSESLFDADLTGSLAIVMGSEDEGISKEVLKLCDRQVAIPLSGTIGSLNVSAAAAVMLFEVVRQRLYRNSSPTRG